ncbi:hypothetical protein [uncultured Novosphingobium sp.]|uniref:hypothetical protein n=1 Tax=uncultured Novosphingobium sp. TaxID=292277 RepID=UPI00258D6043|nr:hypothetical protein [uncultured Novosphingobium sp.]
MTKAQAVWQDPALLPHALDAQGRIGFVHADLDAARRLAFLDGRAQFWTTDGPLLPAQDFAALAADAPPRRVLLHMAFGGSTLAARLLDVPGITRVWREPAIEIALADAIVLGGVGPTTPRVIDALLARPVAGETALSKPSNWANVLTPYWAATGAQLALMTMAPRPYLVAVFRGGRDRISYVLRSAAHFARMVRGGDALLAAAAQTSPQEPPSLLPAARLALVSLDLQYRLFAGAGPRPGVDAATFKRDPVAGAMLLAQALELPLTEQQMAKRFTALADRHAKGGAPFDPAQESALDDEVERHHGSVFAHALDWAAEAGLRFSLSQPTPPDRET